MTPTEPTPNGCAVCGDAQRCHGTQYHPTTGLHKYIEPTDAQRKQRMLARRMTPATSEHEWTPWTRGRWAETRLCRNCLAEETRDFA